MTSMINRSFNISTTVASYSMLHAMQSRADQSSLQSFVDMGGSAGATSLVRGACVYAMESAFLAQLVGSSSVL
jgi:hypothetical protein